jgi:hypothetical protein
LFYSTDFINFTAYDNQTTGAFNTINSMGDVYEVGDNFVSGMSGTLQFKNISTSTTINPAQTDSSSYRMIIPIRNPNTNSLFRTSSYNTTANCLIFKSVNDGATWTVAYQGTGLLVGVKWVNDRLIAFSSSGNIFVSTDDGVNWSVVATGVSGTVYDACYCGTNYFCVGGSGSGTNISYSSNPGVTSWTSGNVNAGTSIISQAVTNGTTIVVKNLGTAVALASATPTTYTGWTSLTYGYIGYDGTKFIGFYYSGSEMTVQTSANGTTGWTTVTQTKPVYANSTVGSSNLSGAYGYTYFDGYHYYIAHNGISQYIGSLLKSADLASWEVLSSNITSFNTVMLSNLGTRLEYGGSVTTSTPTTHMTIYPSSAPRLPGSVGYWRSA